MQVKVLGGTWERKWSIPDSQKRKILMHLFREASLEICTTAWKKEAAAVDFDTILSRGSEGMLPLRAFFEEKYVQLALDTMMIDWLEMLVGIT